MCFLIVICSPLFVRGEDSLKACLLIVQCDSGHINGDLIACARYRIYDMCAKALLNKTQCSHTTHVLFIIHLPVQVVGSSFVGFQGDPWVSCHIDELRPSEEGTLTLEGAQGVAISRLFYSGPKQNVPELERQVSDFTNSLEGMVFEHTRSMERGEDEDEMEEGGGHQETENEGDMQVMDIENEEETESSSGSREERDKSMEQEEGEGGDDDMIEREGPVRSPVTSVVESIEPAGNMEGVTYPRMYQQCSRLNSCIQAAASRLQDSTQNKQRAAERVKLLINLIPRKPEFPLGIYNVCVYMS